MKKIPLRNMKREIINYSLIDDEDYEKINNMGRWYLTDQGYVKKRLFPKNKKSYLVLMHRVIMKAKNCQIIDHINQNRLDNRKINLRFADKSLNGFNRGKRFGGKNKYKGVYYIQRKNGISWYGKTTVRGKQFFTKFCSTEQMALKYYNKLIVKLHKDFAYNI